MSTKHNGQATRRVTLEANNEAAMKVLNDVLTGKREMDGVAQLAMKTTNQYERREQRKLTAARFGLSAIRLLGDEKQIRAYVTATMPIIRKDTKALPGVRT